MMVCAGGTAMLAHDTRQSASELCRAAAAGISAVGGVPEEPQLLTTPQLHWMVSQRNQGQPFTEAAYFDSVLGAYKQLCALHCHGAAAQVQSDLVTATSPMWTLRMQYSRHSTSCQYIAMPLYDKTWIVSKRYQHFDWGQMAPDRQVRLSLILPRPAALVCFSCNRHHRAGNLREMFACPSWKPAPPAVPS